MTAGSTVTAPSRTNGYLPIGPFLHLEPTAVGVLELDRPLAITSPAADAEAPEHRDLLVLVRLHGEPLAMLHLPEPPARLTRQALAAHVFSAAGPAIREHARRHRCCREPAAAADLEAGLTARCACPAASPLSPTSVTVIVPTGNRAEQVVRCIRSLLSLPRQDFEIIVVDNRPGEGGTEDAVPAIGSDRVRYVAESRPGSSVARNRAIARAGGDILVFTDDDVVVDGAWLDWLLAPFADPAVGAVTGMVLPLALDTPAQKNFEGYAGFSKGLVRRRFDLGRHRDDSRLLYPYWGGVFGSGNSVAYRRESLLASGGYDPALGAGSLARAGADIEAMSAAILRGETLVYEPRSVCWHEHRHEEGALQRQVFNYGVGFTAILTKALVRDRRFPVAVLRSIPVVLRLRRRRREAGGSDAIALPRELARLQRKGMLRGPWLYARSVRWVRQLRLDEVIRGA